MVIDGNLVGPFDDAGPLDRATAEQVLSSGLTAFKMTIGGSVGEFDAVNADIAAIDKAIALSPDVYMKIRTVEDLQVAKNTRRVGVIYSFDFAAVHIDRGNDSYGHDHWPVKRSLWSRRAT